MNNLVKIILTKYSSFKKEEQDALIQSVTKIITNSQQLNIWDESITSIVITDSFQEEIDKLAKDWNINSEITYEKEYTVASKIIFNHNIDKPEHVIFIKFEVFLNKSISVKNLLFSQILNVSSKKIFPREILELQFTPQYLSLKTYITISAIEWCKVCYVQKEMKRLNVSSNELMNHNLFLTAFKRSLKRNLFEYNSDKYSAEENLGKFWKNYNNSLHNLVLRILENESDNINYTIKSEERSRDVLYSIIEEIKILTDVLIVDNLFDITLLKEKIKKFSSYFEIHLEKEAKANFHIRLTKDPKDYFRGEIVDTEPRLICFIDILGFSELVAIYESDITSTFLQDIQDSFSLSKEFIFNQKIGGQDVLKHLNYQTFSDNICVSIPFFDNIHDFLTNFNILITYIRGFQFFMMSKGFFTRGGISMGSYYADNNIIFSKGLIRAYYLESKKAIYPRCLIDKEIIQKILSYPKEEISNYGFERVIIFDWEDLAFLNPLIFTKDTISQLKKVFNNMGLNKDSDPLLKVYEQIAKAAGNMTIDLLESVADNEKESFELIKSNILKNLYLHQGNDHIYTKYLWLYELITWILESESERLKFCYLKDLLNENEVS